MAASSAHVRIRRVEDLATASLLASSYPHGYFLPIGNESDHSFDGRYFGAVKTADIVGEAAQRD